MTAIVGILNSESVALAADSAVTFGNGKSVNGANKVFALSYEPPIAIAFYNNGLYLGLTWETIVKSFRKSRLNSIQHHSALDYRSKFLEYLELVSSKFQENEIAEDWRIKFTIFLDELSREYNQYCLSLEDKGLVNPIAVLEEIEEELKSKPIIVQNLPGQDKFLAFFKNNNILEIDDTFEFSKSPICVDVVRLCKIFYESNALRY
jgi:hypothetical protein